MPVKTIPRYLDFYHMRCITIGAERFRRYSLSGRLKRKPILNDPLPVINSLMNIYYKPLLLFFFTAAIFISCLNVDIVSAQQTAFEPVVSLTAEERAWLAAHPDIRLGYTDNLEPEVIVDPDGTYSGMLVDFLDALNERLGMRMGLRVYSIPELIDKAKTKSIDGIPNLHPEYADSLGLLKTQVYWPAYLAVFARKGASFVSPDDFADKRVAIIDKVHITQKFMDQYGKQAAIVKVDNALEGLRSVENGTADLFLGLSYNSFFIAKYQLFNVVTAHVFLDSPEWFGIGIRKDWPVFVSILNKGIASFSKQEIHAIITKWSYLPARKDTIKLTSEEQAWLAQNHTVRVRVVNFPPYIFIGKDEIAGIAIDYLKLVAERSGVTFEFVHETRPWQKALESLMKSQGPDLVTSVSPIAERKPYMNFSTPYIVSPRVIFTRTDAEFITGIDELRGRSLAVPNGTLVHKRLEEEYPDIDLLLFDTDIKSIEAVSLGKADAYIGNLVNASYEILQKGFANLKIASPSPFGDDVYTFGIRKDWPELVSIIDKALDTRSVEEEAAIRTKYFKLQYEHGLNPADVLKWILIAAGGTFGIIFFFVFWNRSLARKVQGRTSDLANINEALTAEVAQRAQAEEQLRESRDYLESLTDSLADAVFSVSMPDRTITWAKDTFGVLGYEPSECIGKSTEFLYPTREDHVALGNAMNSAIAEGKVVLHLEQNLSKNNGVVFPADITLSIFKLHGKVVSMTGIVRDISERRKAEEALKESEEKFRHLVEQSPLSIQVLNTEGQLIQVNQAWKQLWGVSGNFSPEVFEKWNIFQDEEAKRIGILPHIEKAFKGESVVLPAVEYDASSTMEDLKIRGTETNKRWVQARFYPITDSKGKVVNVVGIEEDITIKKQNEQQVLHYQERLKALASQLTLAEEKERRVIAADLHDHVGHSLALARMQLNSIPETESELERKILVKDISNIMLQALQDTRHLIFALSSPSMNEIGLSAAISEWLEEHVEKRHGLTTEYVGDIADQHKLTLDENVRALLFRNVRELLHNVVKHAKANKVHVHLTENTDMVKIVVEDDGIGFDIDAIQDKDSKEGGFGLFSIQERMTDLGGSFEIQSEPGKGCRVVLAVPVEGKKD